jgi:hypothetical protein
MRHSKPGSGAWGSRRRTSVVAHAPDNAGAPGVVSSFRIPSWTEGITNRPCGGFLVRPPVWGGAMPAGAHVPRDAAGVVLRPMFATPPSGGGFAAHVPGDTAVPGTPPAAHGRQVKPPQWFCDTAGVVLRHRRSGFATHVPRDTWHMGRNEVLLRLQSSLRGSPARIPIQHGRVLPV